MKLSRWQKFGAIPISLSLAATAFTTPSLAVGAATSQSTATSNSTKTMLLGWDDGYQLAQVSDNCRQVVARYGVSVRREPTTNSESLGLIPYGRNVSIKNRGVNRWVPTSAPLEGYVYAGDLGLCRETSPPSNCRQVQAYAGLNVRQEPSRFGAIAGYVPNGRRVTIDNQGANGWVPISVPFTGYVSANYLIYCQ